jgi:ribosomal protein S18 acetylase RimI-like enzyme
MMVAQPEEVRVRSARHADVPALGAIWQELMDLHERTDARFALADDALIRWRGMAHDMLNRDDGFLHVAEYGGRAAGFCLGWLAKNPPIYKVAEVGFISEIAVAEVQRRRGVGRALIRSAREWFRGRDVHEYQLSTAVWNDEAKAFWQAIGGEPLLLRYRFSVDTDGR